MIVAGLYNRHVHDIHTLSTFKTTENMPHYYGTFVAIILKDCSCIFFEYSYFIIHF